MNTNWLGKVFDWLGEVFERFNPSAFRFLAAVLPYLTPYPVAWLTSHSASTFLGFTPKVSFVLVFILEGIGLWFTTLLVDSVVDFVRSKNSKTGFIVLLFGGVVSAYVVILVVLNVVLENSTGSVNPYLSLVITLLCFLPLLTGVGNGYYKLKLEYKTETEKAKIHQEELEEKIRKEKSEERIKKYAMKHGYESTSESIMKLPNQFRNNNGTSRSRNGSSKNTSGTIGRPSIHQQRVFQFMEQYYSETGNVASFSEVMKELNLPQSTASRLRGEWIASKQS